METWEGWALAVAGFLAVGWLDKSSARRAQAREARKAAQRAAKQAAKVAPASRQEIPISPMQRALEQLAERDAQIATMKTAHAKEVAALKAQHEAVIEALIGDQADVLKDLKRQLKTAQEAAQHWERAYRNLEEHPPVPPSQPVKDTDGQFRRLRALIIKELHPDHAAADSVDKALRTEVFKALWPKIEALSDHG